MIMVKLMGGLGNQLFQYATARRLAEKNAVPLKLDTSFFDAQDAATTVRQFSLDAFSIEATKASPGEICALVKYRQKHMRFFGTLWNLWAADDSIYIKEKGGYGFHPEILGLKDGVYLDGYWQSEKYFLDSETTLRKEITLKNLSTAFLSLQKEIVSRTSAFLHIRRGDYISNPQLLERYGVCDADYYKKGASIIAEKFPDVYFYIFSDDISWAQKNLSLPYPHSFISNTGLTDAEELMLMAATHHAIIANSTFSWWGAWLIQNRNKIVVAPKQWFKDISLIPSDLIPNSWIQL